MKRILVVYAKAARPLIGKQRDQNRGNSVVGPIRPRGGKAPKRNQRSMNVAERKMLHVKEDYGPN